MRISLRRVNNAAGVLSTLPAARLGAPGRTYSSALQRQELDLDTPSKKNGEWVFPHDEDYKEGSQHGLLTIQELTAEAILELADQDSEVLAIRVPNYYPVSACERLVNWAVGHEDRGHYDHEINEEINGEQVSRKEYLGVDRIGTPFNSTYNAANPSEPRDWNDDAVQKYYGDVEPFKQQLTAACYPEENVMSKVIRTLNKAWPTGAGVAEFQGEEMNAGIVRITNSNEKTEISHVDAVPSTYMRLEIQLSTNVFLAAPSQGGELEVTRTRARSFEEIASLPSDFDWDKLDDIDRENGPLLIQPQAGDLVLINTRRPHSTRVFPSGTGPRVSVACFLGTENVEDLGSTPLLCWT